MNVSRLEILASGGGTTALAVLESTRRGKLAGLVEVVGLIVSKANIGVIDKFYNADFPLHRIALIDPKGLSPDEFGKQILEEMRAREATQFGQYGWTPLTPKGVIAEFSGINQHPAGLDPSLQGSHPDFGGKGMRGKAAIAAQLYFARIVSRPFWAEATCHLVTEEFDKGLLIRNNGMEIDTSWTVDELQQKLLPLEHTTQIDALEQIALYGLTGHTRTARLILPEEEGALREARQQAIADYPNG